jgi:hypothetical protein
MKMKCGLSFILLILFSGSYAQDVALFQSNEPLNLRATGSIKSIKKKSNDSTLVAGKFEYKQDSLWMTVPIQARVRGNFRLKECYFPPLKLKFKKKDVKGSLFEGNKALKLVVPCKTSSGKNELIRREYLCYRFYQELSPYFFRTRLARLELTEISRKKPRTYTLLTFFVEDNSMVAKRNGGRVTEMKGVSPAAFDEQQSVRNDFFQYMIGNADWSSIYQHNSNTLIVQSKFIPLSYDFDMSGFVNAAYAQANAPQLGTGDVRERVYRGFCKSNSAMQEIRKEFLEKERALIAIIDQHDKSFSTFEMNDMKDYLGGFFEILKDDYRFESSVLKGCRTH